MTNKKKLVANFTFMLFTACSHVNYKAEMPNGNDKGIIFQGNNLVFSIPADQPQDKMKLSFAGIKDGNLLHLRLQFIRKGQFNPSSPETIDPKELTIQIEGEGAKLTPVQIYAAKKHPPLIELTKSPTQAVELVYKLPVATGEKPTFEFFVFNWRVQYAKAAFASNSVRFDLQDTDVASNADDPDFAQYGDDDAV